jgi:hypothetical protein
LIGLFAAGPVGSDGLVPRSCIAYEDQQDGSDVSDRLVVSCKTIDIQDGLIDNQTPGDIRALPITAIEYVSGGPFTLKVHLRGVVPRAPPTRCITTLL